ncbi:MULTISPECIES: SlyX family protein [Marichromatium]|uniref:SlyX protein n=1 Tax=Marichromatium gracile TaxID=1048 RepID=A0A4R4A8K9_MARGR|nr:MULTISPECIES: SlyX family protein [Marichromatium]MBO8087473.1 SlyX family protein [Marichromatium sp.]MBK1709877.1 hypothetical protein [Marichromatium gracile]RNE89267.1 SlyX family protein [Marichromatium sp. AB31]RNE92871.1 SlyX family protein [Marichromatium sp. AB32]TCW34856.1 SlyX protein [Marichromatium gracile]
MTEITPQDEAITELQLRLTYQEDDLKQLNAVVTRQQTEIDALREELAKVRAWISSALSARDDQTGGAPSDEPPPPHY